jgi:serine/threonine protein kinase
MIIYQRNVLLNPELHCQITDFGSTRHFEAAVTRSTTAFVINFVAPELFGACTTCGLSPTDCDGPQEDQKRRKTMATDVYAFGCLYYAVRPDFYLVGALIQNSLYRYSLIPFRFMTWTTPGKSCNLS